MTPEHTKLECPQEDRLIGIEEDFKNHRKWRSETTSSLNDINILLATLNERLRAKMENFENHVRAGVAFRVAIVSVATVLAVSIITAVYAYGGLAMQVKVNTERWDRFLAAESKVLTGVLNDKARGN